MLKKYLFLYLYIFKKLQKSLLKIIIVIINIIFSFILLGELLMFQFIIGLLSQFFTFVGYIKNGAYPNALTIEEEEYWVDKLLNEKSNKAREVLIEHNLRLVAHVAKKYESKNELQEDLISIGTIGLIKACDTYSTNKGVRIATYAARCIENEILMHLRSNKKNYKNVSLYDSIGQDKDGAEITLMDIIPSNDTPIQEIIDLNDKISVLKQFYNVLDEREMEILSLRYGLNNENEHTQKEVAKKYNISRSYVSRIEKRALTKLLQEFKKNNKIL